MGRSRTDLCITVPSFFRCPISLDVMKSPVSLSTGVTYDRSSIQRWLDSGHNTCPATMQVLNSKDFVPNHTLHRLIKLWYSNSHPITPLSQPSSQPQSCLSSKQIETQIVEFDNNPNPERKFEVLVKVLCFASETVENRKFLSSNDAFWGVILGIVSDPGSNPDHVEVGLKLFHLVPPKFTVLEISKRYPVFLCSLTRILKSGRPETRVVVVGILERISPDPDSRKAVFGTPEMLLELLRVLNCVSEMKTDEGSLVISSLIALSSPRTNKARLVRAGGVQAIGKLLEGSDSDTKVNELALTLLESLAGSAEARTAMGDVVPIVVRKLMKVSGPANEHGVAVLWSLCYLFRDQRAKEAVMRSNDGVGKILLLMQSGCSPVVKRMCCDLLRVFRVTSKSCLSSYDTKTTHIMPC